ncbi:MAG TPA: phospholipid carrier-dependent glycosyltransferase, partial [Patescibacteria group bacterium]|nr:phospholipid carrier-dependent glycosyltransferase [Patescibacteria group bacterium]
MKSEIRKNLLVIILVIAAVLRFWQLGQNPPGLTWDEAAWGYNAYAIGIDGRDEFGRFLPVDYLESFGDFKPPMYAYLTVIPVWLLGLNAFATRFASALFGVMSVGVVYGLVGELFSGKTENEFSSSRKKSIALAAAALLAISPWHVNLSRAAFEANVASFFIVAGMWLFLRWIRLENGKMAG